MRLETINYSATGTAVGSGLGATATATGWIATTNEYIPLTMGVVAILGLVISFLTHLEKRKQTKLIEKGINTTVPKK